MRTAKPKSMTFHAFAQTWKGGESVPPGTSISLEGFIVAHVAGPKDSDPSVCGRLGAGCTMLEFSEAIAGLRAGRFDGLYLERPGQKMLLLAIRGEKVA